MLVGTEAYEAAGGVIVRDLFIEDGGGWLADPALLDRLVSELTAHRTAALREALAADPDAALVAVTHALPLAAFYPSGYDLGTCLEIEPKSAVLRGPKTISRVERPIRLRRSRRQQASEGSAAGASGA